MKRPLLTISFCLCIVNAFSQWNINGAHINNTNTGNVGIGTINPLTKFQLMETSAGQTPDGLTATNGILISGNNTGGSLNMGIDGSGTYSSSFYSWIQSRHRDQPNYYDLALNPIGGNVGVGTAQPATKLHVMDTNSGGSPSTSLPTQGILISGHGTGGSLNIGIDATGNFYSWIQSRNRSNENTYNLALNPNGGNVGIGTTNPTEKLTVNGNVYSKEVKVDVNAGTGPDYVFEPTYQLPSLTEIENYIKANKHLPEVPSAKEMETDGINLSEMNMLLLKKVEELTLYVIELKKENEKQNEVIKTLLQK